MAYDSKRGVVVLFGGTGDCGGTCSDTWEWNGATWSQRISSDAPPGRWAHDLAYDSARGVVVLFGGMGAGDGLDDTWEWNGTNWTLRTPANRPHGRYFYAMAYDNMRGVVVLFGGYYYVGGQGYYLDDTWEYNGTNWVQRSPANHPSVRYGHALVYDSARGVVVLFGGTENGQNRMGDTWEWDGTNWTQRSPANNPPGQIAHAMAYDSARGTTVLFGGEVGPDETWEWDGTNWTERTPANHPPARAGHAMAYDTAREATVLFGGGSITGAMLADTWVYGPPVSRPTLFPIDNSDDDGDYLVQWSTVTEAITYTLEEDDDISFPSPTVRYQGDQISYQVSGQGSGDWCYRVKASNANGDSYWSNIESAGVRPGAPTLSPIENGDGDGAYLVDWNDATGATSYRMEEDDNSAFTSPTARYTGASSQYEMNGQHWGTWYYRVLASNSGGDSPWSNTESVIVDHVPPDAPILYPISNPDGNGDYLVDWSDANGATGYCLEEDDNSAFTSPTVRYTGASSQYEVVGQVGGTWYYRACASNASGDSPWSNTEYASVIPAAPILAPISNPDGNGDYLVDWNDVTGATSYCLEEDDNSAFTSPTPRYTGASSQYQVTGQQGGTWYYRVRASNVAGDSPWSNTESVGVTPAAPVLAPISNPDGNGDYLVEWSGVPGVTSHGL